MKELKINELQDTPYAYVYALGDIIKTRSTYVINVALKIHAKEKLFFVRRPFNEMLFLRPGQPIHFGRLKHGNANKNAKPVTATIPSLGDYTKCTAYPELRGLFHLRGNRELGSQYIFKYQTDHGELLIPAGELLRALFLFNSKMATNILHRTGIDMLYQAQPYNGESKFELNFSEQFSGSNIDDRFAEHFAWIVTNPKNLNAWHSFYTSLHKQFQDTPTSAKLLFSPPDIRNFKITCTGLQKDHRTLVLEILNKHNLYYPFDELAYTHPSFKKTMRTTSAQRRTRQTRSGKNDLTSFSVPSTPVASPAKSQQRFDLPPTKTQFTKRAKITKEYWGNEFRERKVSLPTAPNGSSADGKSKVKIKEVGTGEPLATGNVPPVELSNLERCYIAPTFEMKLFEQAIREMANQVKTAQFSCSVAYLPSGSNFSQFDSDRRTCGIAHIQFEDGRFMYILEMDRSGGHSLKTAIFYPKEGVPNDWVKLFLTRVVQVATQNYGRIPADALPRVADKVSSYRLAHCKFCSNITSKEAFEVLAKRWANRLTNAVFDLKE